jgi:hypothetical protein
MPRRVYLLGVGLTLVALAFALTKALLSESGITAAKVRRIRPGMSREQVQRVLGGSGEVEGSELDGPWSSRVYAWSGPEGTAYVFIGYRRAIPGVDEGRGVVRRAFFSRRTARTGFLSHLRGKKKKEKERKRGRDSLRDL